MAYYARTAVASIHFFGGGASMEGPSERQRHRRAEGKAGVWGGCAIPILPVWVLCPRFFKIHMQICSYWCFSVSFDLTNCVRVKCWMAKDTLDPVFLLGRSSLGDRPPTPAGSTALPAAATEQREQKLNIFSCHLPAFPLYFPSE